MPWILSTLPRNYNSSFNNFLQQRGRGRWFWKDQNFNQETSLLPSLKRNLLFRPIFNNKFDDNLSRNRDTGRIIYSKWAGEWMRTKMLFDGTVCGFITIHKTLLEKSNLTAFPHHFIPFSSIQQVGPALGNERVEGGQDGRLRRAIQAWSGIIVIALETTAVVYISYQRQRIFPWGELHPPFSASRLIVASTSYRSPEIDVDVLSDSLWRERKGGRERKEKERKEGK